jgi:hypothetical protein
MTIQHLFVSKLPDILIQRLPVALPHMPEVLLVRHPLQEVDVTLHFR